MKNKSLLKPKRKYATPVLKHYGSVQKLTFGMGSGGGDGMSTMMDV
ncbi:hypothetical protein [Runella aurantiaca]|nr:hypothetical protein [Runella aurantiaca]